jgi:hypothetical protein
MSEKYFVPKLKTLVENKFATVNIASNVEDLAKKFYDICMVTGTTIGKGIATAYMRKVNYTSISAINAVTVNLIKTYPGFAVDLILASIEGDVFPPGFRASCDRCKGWDPSDGWF